MAVPLMWNRAGRSCRFSITNKNRYFYYSDPLITSGDRIKTSWINENVNARLLFQAAFDKVVWSISATKFCSDVLVGVQEWLIVAQVRS